MSHTADLLADLSPADIGLERMFATFRPIQLEAIEYAVYECEDERVIGMCLPTGSGKSGVALAIQALTRWRTVIATATKGLMGQYSSDTAGGRYPLVDLMGKANYDCVGGVGADNCEEGRDAHCNLIMGSREFGALYTRTVDSTRGRLLSGMALPMPSCNYDRRRMEMMLSPCVVTNYALWLYSRLGWGNVDCLILDEGHEAMNQLANFISVRLYQKELKEYLGCEHDDMPSSIKVSEWVGWAKMMDDTLKENLKVAKLNAHTLKGADRVKAMEKLGDKLALMSDMDDDWIAEARFGGRYGRSWEFDAVWPGRYAESRLFKGVPKVILMSATLKPKAVTDLGVKRGGFAYREWRRIFPRTRCPIYFMPPKTSEGKQVRITKKSGEADLHLWVRHMDGLIDARLNVRIVVLTTSYAYQTLIMEHSRHKSIMVGNTQDPDSESASKVFEKFITTPPPVILCSPSFGAGWNFKDDRCRLLIISKVPLTVPGGADRLMAARLKRDMEYGNNITMQAVAQAVGRPQRSDSDWGEVVITDGTWSWFGPKNEHLAPMAMVKDVRTVESLPKISVDNPSRQGLS